MKVRKSLIIPSLLVASALPIGWALAQAGPPGPPPAAGPGMMGPDMMGPGMGRHGRHFDREMRHSTPEMRARMLDGRIAGAKAALKLNDDQSKLFAPVEEQMRANAAAREKRMEEFRAAMEARRAQAPADASKQPPSPSLADRMERRAKVMTEQAERMKAYAAAFKPFFDSLNDEQKSIVAVVLPGQGRGMGRGHHHRWAMGFGQGPGMGPGQGPGQGPGMGPGMGPGTPPPPKQ